MKESKISHAQCLQQMMHYQSYLNANAKKIQNKEPTVEQKIAWRIDDKTPFASMSVEQLSDAKVYLSAMQKSYLEPENGAHSAPELREAAAQHYEVCKQIDDLWIAARGDLGTDSFAIKSAKDLCTLNIPHLGASVVLHTPQGQQWLQERPKDAPFTIYEFAKSHPHLMLDEDEILIHSFLGLFDVFAQKNEVAWKQQWVCEDDKVESLRARSHHNPLLRLFFYVPKALDQRGAEIAAFKKALRHKEYDVEGGQQRFEYARRELLSAISFSFALNQEDGGQRFSDMFKTLLCDSDMGLSPSESVLFLKTAAPLMKNHKIIAQLSLDALEEYLSIKPHPSDRGKLEQSLRDLYDMTGVPAKSLLKFLMHKAQDNARGVSLFKSPAATKKWIYMMQCVLEQEPNLANHVNEQGQSIPFMVNQVMLKLTPNNPTGGLLESALVKWVDTFGMDPALMAPVFNPVRDCASSTLLSLYEKALIGKSVPVDAVKKARSRL